MTSWGTTDEDRENGQCEGPKTGVSWCACGPKWLEQNEQREVKTEKPEK